MEKHNQSLRSMQFDEDEEQPEVANNQNENEQYPQIQEFDDDESDVRSQSTNQKNSARKYKKKSKRQPQGSVTASVDHLSDTTSQRSSIASDSKKQKQKSNSKSKTKKEKGGKGDYDDEVIEIDGPPNENEHTLGHPTPGGGTVNQDHKLFDEPEIKQEFKLASYQKEEDTFETETSMKKKYKPVSEFITIVTYLISELKKKQSSFNIGIFTVFIVVAFLSLLQSAVDIAPIAFLKLAQDASGAIDFQLTPSASKSFQNGNFYYYNQNPFDGSGTVASNSFLSTIEQLNPYVPNSDSLSLFNFQLIEFNDLKKDLQNMEHFEGFSPRWMIPTKLRNSEKTYLNTSVVLLIIDSEREIDIGLGKHFSHTVLTFEELMGSSQALKYLQVNPSKRDNVDIYFDLSMIKNLITSFGLDEESTLFQFLDKYETLAKSFVSENIASGINFKDFFTKDDLLTLMKLMGIDIENTEVLNLNLEDYLNLGQSLLSDQNLNIKYGDLLKAFPQLAYANYIKNGIPLIDLKYASQTSGALQSLNISEISIRGSDYEYDLAQGENGIWKEIQTQSSQGDDYSQILESALLALLNSISSPDSISNDYVDIQITPNKNKVNQTEDQVEEYQNDTESLINSTTSQTSPNYTTIQGQNIQNNINNINSTQVNQTIDQGINTWNKEAQTINDQISQLPDADGNINGSQLINEGAQYLKGVKMDLNLNDMLNQYININLGSLSKLLISQNVTSVDIYLEQLIDLLFNNLVIQMLPTSFAFDYKAVEGYDSTHGKLSNALGNTAIIDCHDVIYSVVPKLFSQVQSIFNSDNVFVNLFLQRFQTDINLWNNKFSLCNYALQVNGVLKDQVDYYIHSTQDMKQKLIKRGNEMIDRITLSNNVSISAPIMSNQETIDIMKIFLKNGMISVVFFLGILCIQLVYSLMVSDVDDKTYTYGMIRSMGLKKKSLISLISMQSFAFSIPGLASGLIVAYFLNIVVRFILFNISENASSYYLSNNAIVVGILIGFFLPLMSNIIPIQRALSKNLRASLDLYHRTVNELTVSVKRIQDIGLSLNQLVVGITLVVLGILTYYVAPMSFILENYSLFFFILNLVLILMILGLSFVAISFLNPVQEMFLSFFTFVCRDRKIYPLAKKNMNGHVGRNTKTAMMFTIALSFLIFAGTTFQQIAHLIQITLQGTYSADFYASSQLSSIYLDEQGLKRFLELKKNQTIIQSYSFQAPELNKFLGTLAPNFIKNFQVMIATPTNFYTVLTDVYSVQENFLDIADNNFYIPTEIQSGLVLNYTVEGKLDGVEVLFKDDNTEQYNGNKDYFNITTTAYKRTSNNYTEALKVIIPEGLRLALSLDTQTSARICLGFLIEGNLANCNYNYLGNIRVMAQKFPSVYFSKYRQIIYLSSIIISEKQYSDIIQQVVNDYPYMKAKYNSTVFGKNYSNGVPKCNLFIKINPYLSNDQRSLLGNEIRSYFKDEMTFLIDMKDLISSIQSSVFLFQIFVGIVGAIALVLAFFLLLISTTQNIKDNVWEFGVLRAMGLNKSQSYRIYLYEALAVIFGAGTLGVIVGLLVAVTLTAQFTMFVEMPFTLNFPLGLFIAMIALSIVTTIFAVLIPVRDVNKRQIAVVIKGSS